jgi:hypothetical protein
MHLNVYVKDRYGLNPDLNMSTKIEICQHRTLLKLVTAILDFLLSDKQTDRGHMSRHGELVGALFIHFVANAPKIVTA